MRRSFSSVICVALALSAALIAGQATQQGGGQRGTPPPTGTQPQGGRGGRGGGVAIEPGQECPPGTTMTRYLRCTAPEWPVPSIVDYRPKSTLVTPEHPVPKAKYPAVDVHGHIAGNVDSAESLAAFVAKLDSIGVGVFISADQTSGARLQQRIDLVRNSPYKDRIRFFTGLPVQGVGPGWAEKAVAPAGGRREGRRFGRGRSQQGLRHDGPEGRRFPPCRGRADAGSVLGRLRPARDSGVHPHRRAAGVLQRARHAQRALARAVAVSPTAATISRRGSSSSSS